VQVYPNSDEPITFRVIPRTIQLDPVNNLPISVSFLKFDPQFCYKLNMPVRLLGARYNRGENDGGLLIRPVRMIPMYWIPQWKNQLGHFVPPMNPKTGHPIKWRPTKDIPIFVPSTLSSFPASSSMSSSSASSPMSTTTNSTAAVAPSSSLSLDSISGNIVTGFSLSSTSVSPLNYLSSSSSSSSSTSSFSSSSWSTNPPESYFYPPIKEFIKPEEVKFEVEEPPEAIDLDITELQVGFKVKIKDITLPVGLSPIHPNAEHVLAIMQGRSRKRRVKSGQNLYDDEPIKEKTAGKTSTPKAPTPTSNVSPGKVVPTSNVNPGKSAKPSGDKSKK